MGNHVLCSIDGCIRPAVARTWCRAHWKLWRRNGDPTKYSGRSRIPAEARFWQKVDQSNGPDACWPWQGYCDPLGYGFFRLVPGQNMWKTHRVAWALTHEDPGDLWVLHRCDNPPCVNPAHLFLGTPQDNVADRVRKGRSARRPGIRGENSRLSRLTEADVAKIRTRYAAGGITQKELGAEFGVGQTQVGRIIRGTRWAHTT